MDAQVASSTEPFRDYPGTTARIKEFLETRPLYVKLRLPLPDFFDSVIPEKLLLNCSTCKAERPFKVALGPRGSGAGFPPPPVRVSTVWRIPYDCTGCEAEKLQSWVQVNYEREEWIQKVGQVPMWLPTIAKDIKDELGEDSEI